MSNQSPDIDKTKTVPCRKCEQPCVVTLYAAPARVECSDCRQQAKDEAKAAREAARPITLKAACYAVMKSAAAAASGDGQLPMSARTLFYQVRPRIQELTDAQLEYDYFSQNVLVAYQQDHAPLVGLYREPRGHLHEPHTGVSVPLGTREVGAYEPTDWTYRRILYVEKEGLWPVVEAAQLAERYDMAVVVGQGYPVEAIRAFLGALPAGDYEVFSLHDCDGSGYNLARVLGEATWRMPGHRVEVRDLGLTVEQATARQMATETYLRGDALPAGLKLDATELAWFQGEKVGAKSHRCTRVELNAFTSTELVAFIEERLEQEGATAKLVPPQECIDLRVEWVLRWHIEQAVEEALKEKAGYEALVERVLDEVRHEVEVKNGDVTEALAKNPPTNWRRVVDTSLWTQATDAIKDETETVVEWALTHYPEN